MSDGPRTSPFRWWGARGEGCSTLGFWPAGKTMGRSSCPTLCPPQCLAQGESHKWPPYINMDFLFSRTVFLKLYSTHESLGILLTCRYTLNRSSIGPSSLHLLDDTSASGPQATFSRITTESSMHLKPAGNHQDQQEKHCWEDGT